MARKTPRDRLFRYRIGQRVRWAGDPEVQPALIHQCRYTERVQWLGPVVEYLVSTMAFPVALWAAEADITPWEETK